MSKSLPAVTVLLRDSWDLFRKTWNDSLKVTIWLLYIGLIRFGLLLFIHRFPEASISLLPAEIILIALTLWTGIRAIQVMFQLEAGEKPTISKKESNEAWKLVLPILWIGLLNTLIIIGGSFLLILPGIYFAIALSFSNYILIDEGIHGTSALSKSRDLIKGRWWATLGRLLLGGLCFGIILFTLSSVLFYLIGSIAGSENFGTLLNEKNAIAKAVNTLLQAILQAALLPFIIGFQVKLYRSLKTTK